MATDAIVAAVILILLPHPSRGLPRGVTKYRNPWQSPRINREARTANPITNSSNFPVDYDTQHGHRPVRACRPAVDTPEQHRTNRTAQQPPLHLLSRLTALLLLSLLTVLLLILLSILTVLLTRLPLIALLLLLPLP